jgi:maltodextrin utilization protein YvdJ
VARAKAVLESVPAKAAPRAAKKKPSRKRVASPRQVFERRYVQTVRSVDLWSVLKVSICFYLCALIVFLVAGVLLWWIASAAGVVSSIESFVGELVNNKDFKLLSWEVLRASTLIGLVVVCLLTVMTVLAAAFYNLFSELLGGVEVTVVEQEELDG